MPPLPNTYLFHHVHHSKSKVPPAWNRDKTARWEVLPPASLPCPTCLSASGVLPPGHPAGWYQMPFWHQHFAGARKGEEGFSVGKVGVEGPTWSRTRTCSRLRGEAGEMSQVFPQIPFQLLCDVERGHRALPEQGSADRPVSDLFTIREAHVRCISDNWWSPSKFSK